MAVDPRKALAPRDPRHNAIVHVPPARDGYFPTGLFCASPTVLEAINVVLRDRGVPPLWVQADGTIGPTDPLLLTAHFVPSPFVC
jgi:hypothetical protein